MRYLLLPFLLITLAFSGCGSDEAPLPAGSVSRLTFIPAHDSQGQVPIFSTICTSSGSSVVCTPIIVGWIPVTEHHPDEYNVTMFACDPQAHCRNETFGVSREIFGLLKVGTWFDRRSPFVPKNI